MTSIPQKIFEALKIHDKVDILINNAGISYRGEIDDTNLDVDMKLMTVNYFAQVAMIKGETYRILANDYLLLNFQSCLIKQDLLYVTFKSTKSV